MKTTHPPIPAELLTAAQMRSAERAAMDAGEVTGLELMERAGHGVVDALLGKWPGFARTAHRARVFCGPGNNGGDGFVIARLLERRGWEVTVFLYGAPERLPPDAAANMARWRGIGGIRDWPGPDLGHDPITCDLVVDALFGTGLTRPLDPAAGFDLMLPEWDQRDHPARPRIVAVDIPSGLCADSGRYLGSGPRLWADLTVSFHRRKLGHVLADGPFACGDTQIADIGLSPARKGTGASAEQVRLAEAQSTPLTKSDAFGWQAHKYTHGHALILSGPATRTGAARLAARGALRIGAGLVTVAAPADALPEHAAQLTAIMLREAATPDALQSLLEDTRLNALCLGPGMGLTDHTRAMVETALSANRKTVLDADALTAFEASPDTLFAALHRDTVLTPHAGEFARLFPDIAEKLAAPATTGPAYSKLDATREAAKRAGCTVLFKGPDTVIADPTGAARINASLHDRAAPWLATAGAGDVLAGFITGLLARGFPPLDAAATAAWLHTECALSLGPGLIAEDLPEELPRVFRALGV